MPTQQSVAAAIASPDSKRVIPFLVGGYPDQDTFISTLTALDAQGAPAIEVGFPFSDPIADGPVIAQAMHETLKAGVTTASLFDAISSARQSLNCTLVAMISVSIVAKLGYQQFSEHAAKAGFNALLVPDAPIDEIEPIAQAASDNGLELSLLVAPSTPTDRAAQITKACTAFTYLLARAGVTGVNNRADALRSPNLNERVNALRPHAKAPIACGFGISTPDDVRRVLEHADAAIVGTALVRAMRDAANDGNVNPSAAAAEQFAKLTQAR